MSTHRIAELADWAVQLEPGPADEELAHRSLIDTIAVTLAAAEDPIAAQTAGLPPALRWSAIGHALDFDDVHLPSTSHISVVCATATLAAGGGAREYLAGAGVMARLGAALGWRHYAAGWHTTCTAGAPAAAVTAGLALGLDAEGLSRAMALAVPAAGGNQRAFGTTGKALQVGFATDAGVRAARLAAAGASADPSTLEHWFALLSGEKEITLDGPPIPDGLAIKLHPCCYAMQRPISATRALTHPNRDTTEVARIIVETPEAAALPLIHHKPRTGLQAKFSLEYAIAATLLDEFPDPASFTDTAATRRAVTPLIDRIETRTYPDGTDILAGDVRITIESTDGSSTDTMLKLPRGHPHQPPTEAELTAKVTGCVGETRSAELTQLDWDTAARLFHETLPSGKSSTPSE
jgi:2-methylcitrate dehydratase PrpD